MAQSNDRELDAFLRRRSRLNRLYAELGREPEEPSAATDRAVLDAARRAVTAAAAPPATGPRWRPRPVAAHWTVPLGVAAVVVLSVGIVTLMTARDRSAVRPAPEPRALEQAGSRSPAARAGAPTAADAGRESPQTSGEARKGAAAPVGPILDTPPSAAPSLRDETIGPRAETAQPAGREKAAAIATDTASRGAPPSDPEHDFDAALPRIRALVAAGQVDEAAAALAALRERYPDRELPPDLRDFTRKAW